MNCTSWLFRTVAVALTAVSPAWADAPPAPDPGPGFAIKGFGTLGLAHSNDANAQYVRDLSQPDGLQDGWSGKIDSILGVQANLALGSDTEAVLQAVSRYRYDGSWRPELSWAFLRHDFSPDATVRLGRMGTEFYMQADSRLVGYANLTVRPAPDYYGVLVISYFDGIDASLTADTGYGLLRGKLFAGQAAEETPFAEPDYTWDLSGSPMYGGYLDYLNGPWQVRISHSQIQFKHQQPLNAIAGFDIVGMAPELSIVDTWADYDAIGVAYDEGRLQVHGQISSIRYESSAYEDTKAGYLVAGYRIGQFTPYLGYSRVWSKQSPLTTPMPPEAAAAVRGVMAQTHSDQHTITLGSRWDLARNMALKAQLDLVRGKPESRFPMRNANPDWDGSMNVFSLSLDFVF